MANVSSPPLRKIQLPKEAPLQVLRLVEAAYNCSKRGGILPHSSS